MTANQPPAVMKRIVSFFSFHPAVRFIGGTFRNRRGRELNTNAIVWRASLLIVAFRPEFGLPQELDVRDLTGLSSPVCILRQAVMFSFLLRTPRDQQIFLVRL